MEWKVSWPLDNNFLGGFEGFFNLSNYPLENHKLIVSFVIVNLGLRIAFVFV